MTKYILHGGKPSKPSRENQIFYEEMFVGLPDPIKLLCVYFARDQKSHDWFQMLEDDKKCISTFCPNRSVSCILASDQIDVFSSQIIGSDIIFIKGGDTSTLLSTLKRCPSIESLWIGKVVAGSSAGALVLSNYYYDGDLDICNRGLGLLPIKLICHWSNARIEKIEKLKHIGNDIEIVKIPEEHYIVYQ